MDESSVAMIGSVNQHRLRRLGADHGEAGLIARLRATVDEPIVAGAAIRALGQRIDAAPQIRTHLHRLVAELQVGDERLRRRKLTAVLGLDGISGVLALVAPTAPDAELVELCRVPLNRIIAGRVGLR